MHMQQTWPAVRHGNLPRNAPQRLESPGEVQSIDRLGQEMGQTSQFPG
jgi:hypothetical protein